MILSWYCIEAGIFLPTYFYGYLKKSHVKIISGNRTDYHADINESDAKQYIQFRFHCVLFAMIQ